MRPNRPQMFMEILTALVLAGTVFLYFSKTY